MRTSEKNLQSLLDSLYRTFDSRFISPDPLEFVHRYRRRDDREIVALLASSLAFGRVEQIRESIERLLGILGPAPADFVRRFNPRRDAEAISRFRHRWIGGTDIASLLAALRRLFAKSGSLRAAFLEGYNPSSGSVRPALSRFVERLRGPLVGPSRGIRCLIPSPADGSACKRLNLFLRWMVRGPDGLDLGLWPEVSRSKLVIPLDVHVARISRTLGLSRRCTPDWKMAEEVTASLRRFDPDDPVKYDFSLCHLGILDRLSRRAGTPPRMR